VQDASYTLLRSACPVPPEVRSAASRSTHLQQHVAQLCLQGLHGAEPTLQVLPELLKQHKGLCGPDALCLRTAHIRGDHMPHAANAHACSSLHTRAHRHKHTHSYAPTPTHTHPHSNAHTYQPAPICTYTIIHPHPLHPISSAHPHIHSMLSMQLRAARALMLLAPAKFGHPPSSSACLKHWTGGGHA